MATSAIHVLLAVAWLASVEASTESPVVSLKNGGALQGYSFERNNETIFAFEGIPYARPPVGERRFKDPEEAESWSGLRNATATGNLCVQYNLLFRNVIGEEDCLFLNVYNTNPPEKWASTKQPVIVWVHGGGFKMGSGNMDRARPDHLLKQGFVFVSFNYRLSVMGFLNTEDSTAPGNAGLKDMVLALRWVKDNIAAFGGDSEQVSILGVSAGGAGVHYLTISPMAKGLFKRAVAMSGTALSPWAIMDERRAAAQRLGARHNCTGAEDLVACLRTVDARTLVTSWGEPAEGQVMNQFWKGTFLPSVEAPGSSATPFLPSLPEVLSKDTSVPAVPLMTGIVDNEGILFFLFTNVVLDDPSRWEALEKGFEDAFGNYLPIEVRTNENLRRLLNFYLENRKIVDAPKDPETMRRLLQMLTDLLFGESAVHAASISADKGAPTYFYEFSYNDPALAVFKKHLLKVPSLPGVAHGDDLPFLFDVGEIPSEESAAVLNRHVSLFTNFMKTGNPTPEGSSLPPWPQFTSEKKTYAEVNKEITYNDHSVTDRLALWKKLEHLSNGSTSETPITPE